MVIARCLGGAPVAARIVYHAIGARVIRMAAMTAVTAAAQAVFTWSGVHVIVVGGGNFMTMDINV